MSRVFLDVNVSPASLTMSPEKNHIEEGGRVSVSCTAVGVSIENEFYYHSGLEIRKTIWFSLLSSLHTKPNWTSLENTLTCLQLGLHRKNFYNYSMQRAYSEWNTAQNLES